MQQYNKNFGCVLHSRGCDIPETRELLILANCELSAKQYHHGLECSTRLIFYPLGILGEHI